MNASSEGPVVFICLSHSVCRREMPAAPHSNSPDCLGATFASHHQNIRGGRSSLSFLLPRCKSAGANEEHSFQVGLGSFQFLRIENRFIVADFWTGNLVVKRFFTVRISL